MARGPHGESSETDTLVRLIWCRSFTYTRTHIDKELDPLTLIQLSLAFPTCVLDNGCHGDVCSECDEPNARDQHSLLADEGQPSLLDTESPHL